MNETVARSGNDSRERELLLEKYEPIAVVGMSVRFPGNNDTPEQFAEFLRAGRAGTGPIPDDRWDVPAYYSDEAGARGKMIQAQGGFVSRVEDFDPKFFNISPKEAACIDPQHRLLLECAWQALESANIDPAGLRDGDGGVYVGIGQFDFGIVVEGLDFADLEANMGPGTAHSAACGRLSYFLGWRGPCICVDTACSASLVALHLAVQGLRRRECSIALCGGVNVIAHPRNHIIFSQSNMLSPDGRCKTFDDAADGYARSEGCAMLALKRLSDAKRDGDRILALVRGSSVRQDGESGGLTVPNGTAQVALMREALASAMLEPGDIQYVEAHGTGTPLGDPIEIGAIDTVFAESHSVSDPIVVGSVKTNIGHMEAAAGVSGVAKAILQLQEGVIYPHIHLQTPSRRIPWDRYRVTVPTTVLPWQAPRRRALVNSFGFAGTIATVVLEQAPPVKAAAGVDASDDKPVFTLSAKNQASLKPQLERYRRFLDENPDLSLADLCYTTNIARTHLNARVAGIVRSRTELERLLDDEIAHADTERPGRGEFRGSNVGFLFTGQGSQHVGMGRALYAQYPVFRRELDACDRLFAPYLGRSIRELMFGETEGADTELQHTLYTQPALFAFEYAAARLWMSWGVKPNVLLGHSIGEIVAATLAGLFTLADATKLVAARARLMQSVSAPGGMVAVRAAAEVVAPLLAGHANVSFGAINAPGQCVISGDIAALASITEALTAKGIGAKPLPVSHAFHSPLMAEVLEPFRDAIQDIEFHEPESSFVSNLTGKVATLAEVGTPDYWVRHIAEPVNFLAGMRSVQKRGKHVFIEVGPSAALTNLGRQCGEASEHLWLASSTPSRDEDGTTIRKALVDAYVAGLPISWSGHHQQRPGRRIALPNYAFDRRRYSIPLQLGRKQGATVAVAGHHPLLGEDISSSEQRASGEREFRTHLDPSRPAYLADHIVMGQVVFPGAGYVEVLFALQDAVFGETSRVVRQLRILEPLFLNADAATEVRTRLRPGADGTLRVEVASRIAARDGAIERVHVTALLDAEPGTRDALSHVSARLSALATASGPAESEHFPDDIYAQYVELGLPYGAEFRRIRRVARHADNFAIGELRGIDTSAAEHLPASVLDCAMQTLAAVADLSDAYLPIGFDSIELLRKPKGDLRTLIQLTTPAVAADGAAGDLGADILVLDGDRIVFIVEGLRLKRVASAASGRRLLHEPRWIKRSLVAPKGAPARVREILVAQRSDTEFATLAGALTDASVNLSFAADAAEVGRVLAERPGIGDLCWFWRSAPELEGETRLRVECQQNYTALLDLVAELERLGFGRELRVMLVTEGAQWLPGDEQGDRPAEQLAASSLWGFGHVLLNEYPAFKTTLLDLPPGGAGTTDYQPLLDEWVSGEAASDEFQLAYRRGIRHVKRVSPVLPATGQDPNFELSITEYGQFANIKPVPSADVEPVGDEITVRVHAAGLNFKDVLNALGMLRQYALENGIDYKPLPLGFEASGTVVAAGPDAEFVVGDEVVLSRLGCMKKRVTVPSTVAVRKPSSISFAEASGLPAAYVTAHYALHQLAKIRRGDRVLIHAAAGGVGQAAVQLAKLAGAEVYATASPRKWPLLRAQGIQHVMSSRSLDFSDEILRVTDGRGVDIVLNSLNKEYVAAGVRCLAEHGRFVELGKIGIWSKDQMRSERPDVDYHNFDLSEFTEEEFNRLNKHILQEVVARIEAGDLAPLPTVSYTFDEVEEAFGVLSRGGNTGKLVLSFDEQPAQSDPAPKLSPGETYLVTGGLGALGVVTIQKLVKDGARHVAIVSRRQLSERDLSALKASVGDDVALSVYQGDIARGPDVARIVGAIGETGAPLGGVIHAAGVLADAPLIKQTWESVDKVLGPKVYGTWHLHEATRSAPSVKFFITYSSISSILGAPGQGNYAAGNHFMDLLMQWRVAHGLPGFSANWGPWAEVGMAATLTTQQIKSIEERGIKFVKPAEGMRALWKTLGRGRPQSMIGEFDWERYVTSQPVADALFREVLPKGGGPVASIDLDALVAQTRADREATIRDILRARVATVLRFDSPEDVEFDAKFVELGLDSLAAVELKNALEATFRIPLPTSALFDYPAILALAEFISRQLVPVAPEAPAEALISDVDVLSDADADAELDALRALAS
jgi:myxalamid-type polyketide synthase MxaB